MNRLFSAMNRPQRERSVSNKVATVLAACLWIVRGLLAATLPAPERHRVQDGAASAARWSLFLGVVEGTLGLLLYIFGALAYMGPLGGDLGLALLESDLTIDTFHIRGGGLLTWFSWHLQAEAWLYMYF